MKAGIVGGRKFNDLKTFNDGIVDFTRKHSLITEVISGGAKGADTLAAKFAKNYNLPLTEFLPDWEKYGRSAGFKRNKDIVEACEVLIAFWDGKSKGTKSSIDLAMKLGKLVFIIYYTEE